MMRVIKVGTRQSKLAMTQTQQVVDQLKALNPEVSFELVPYKTKGDKLVHVSLQEIGGKGVFVKDIEQALLDKDVDIAVHSLKDVPALLAEGCVLGAIPRREDVRDCLLVREDGMTFENLPAGAVVGTSSQRRQVQLQGRRPDLRFEALRGNIDTRIRKLQEGEYDAIILARAGLNRLGWTDKADLNIWPLDMATCLPAISQGALGIECRADDEGVLSVLASVHDKDTADCVSLERAVLGLMNADCTFPIAALAEKVGDDFSLRAMLADENGRCLFAHAQGALSDDLAQEVVASLREQGAVGGR